MGGRHQRQRREATGPRDRADGSHDVTFAGDSAWVTNYGDGTKSRIAAKTNKPTTIKVGTNPVGIAHTGDAVWVADSRSDQITRIDITTGKVTTVPFGGSPSWTASDQHTDVVTGPSALGAGNPFVVSGYADRLWIADFGGTDTIVVDPTRLSHH